MIRELVQLQLRMLTIGRVTMYCWKWLFEFYKLQ